MFRHGRSVEWHHIDMEHCRRRSVKYRTTELNLPTDFMRAPIEVTPSGRRALPFYRRVIGHPHVLSRGRPGATTVEGAGGWSAWPPDSSVIARHRTSSDTSTILCLSPCTSGASRRRCCCQFIRLTQSQRSAGATAADATAASSSTCVGTRDALRNGRAYLRWFHFYAATKPMRHIAVHASARCGRERAFDYMARTWSSHSS